MNTTRRFLVILLMATASTMAFQVDAAPPITTAYV